MALSSPTWTISTLVAFYILFPFLLPTLQTLSTRTLYMLIILMYQVKRCKSMLSSSLSISLKLCLSISLSPNLSLSLRDRDKVDTIITLAPLQQTFEGLRGNLDSSVIYHWNHQLKPYLFPLRKNRVN